MRHVLLPIFVCVLAVASLASNVIAGPPAKLDGYVKSGGQPVAGAHVIVNRAWPIKGVAFFCPGCYVDCGKSATTDNLGHWSITGLDPTLKFELLVVARGHQPVFELPLDRPTDAVIITELTPRDISKLAKECIVRGRVLDAEGKPVSGAVVTPEMVWWDGGGMGGRVEGLDPLAVTDADGAFDLAYYKPCTMMDLSVSARGYAHACFNGILSATEPRDFTLVEGATVKGRVMRGSKPVPSVEVTMIPDQYRGRVCFDRQQIATDKDGWFQFVNVLAQGPYILSVSSDQLGTGCVEMKTIQVEKDGAEVDAGVLSVIPGCKVAGRVLPPKPGVALKGGKLSLSSASSWFGVTVDLAQDGSFAFPEVPKGSYHVSLHLPGVYLSERNKTLDALNPSMMLGKVEKNIADLTIATSDVEAKPERRDDKDIPDELGGIERPAKK